MTDTLVALIQSSAPYAVAAFMIFFRVGGAMLLLPGFGEQAIPMRIRLVLAIFLTAALFPLVAPRPEFQALGIGFAAILAETASGFAIGFFFRLFVVTLQYAGSIAAQSTSLSQIFGGGATPDPMPAFGNLFVFGGLALAMMSGLHVKLVLMLRDTYDVLPLGGLPSPSDMAGWSVAAVSHAFAAGFALAAPFVLASIIYNIALGVINRAMPQLMVAFIGAPAITLGGLALLAVATPLILVVWLERFDAGLATPIGSYW